ncbi:MAG: SpoIIE family protein phosphatase, partial [Bacteroidetes bacterium]|nr:SpoIIE family protein phosphatase [Bacteroidota bacterium]
MNLNPDNNPNGAPPQGPSTQSGSDRFIELTSLIETAKILNSSLDYRFILNHIMLASMGKLAVSRTASVVCAEGVSRQGEGSRIRIGKGISLSDDVLDELYQLDLEGSVDASDVHNSLARKLADAGVSRIFAIRTSHRLFGYFFIGRKLIGTGFVPTEIEFVSTLCNIAAAAIENASVFQQYKDSNSELQRRVQELQTLFELSKEFSLLVDEPRALRTLEFAIMGQTGARKYAVCLSDGKDPRVVVNRIPGIEVLDLRPLCSLEYPLRPSESVEEPAVSAELANKGVKVVIPFQLKGKTSGLLILGERLSGSPYLDSEINFLSSLCNLAAMAIDNAHLFKESLAKQRLEEELNLAHSIQEKLLPREMPTFPGCDIAAFHIPTKQVGGDYFDVIKLNENLICVAIADVSGKGFPAALLMANLQSAFRALMAAELDLAGITERLNS